MKTGPPGAALGTSGGDAGTIKTDVCTPASSHRTGGPPHCHDTMYKYRQNVNFGEGFLQDSAIERRGGLIKAALCHNCSKIVRIGHPVP